MNFYAPFLCLCAAAQICAETGKPLTLHKFREPGDRLDISIQQELDRAADIGAHWLGVRLRSAVPCAVHTNRTAAALTLLALYPDSGSATATGATARALGRLQCHDADAAAGDLRSAAWSYAALTLYAADRAARTRLEELLRRALADAQADRDSLDLCREILLALSSAPVAAQRRNAPESGESAAETSLLRMWLNARQINRESGGQLLTTEGERIDWRRLYARRIISTQRVSPQGGGFWPGGCEAAEIHKTALALLIIKEL